MIHTEQKRWTSERGWEQVGSSRLAAAPQLVFAFGARALVADTHLYQQIRNFYAGAYIVVCSTAGEILDAEVLDGSISLTALHFEKSIVRFAETNIEGSKDSLSVGKRLAEFLPVEGLVHAMVFSEGLGVNGTFLVEGINDNLPREVTVTGGLVADGTAFAQTLVGRDGPGESHKVVLLGFYGSSLHVGFGSSGGWEDFGEHHVLTRTEGNVVHEIDGRPALDVYTERLGDNVHELPSAALLYPLRVHQHGSTHEVVRTILGVDMATRSMTFAGDMPEGAPVDFMKTTTERLISAASTAATMSMRGTARLDPDVAILVSCIGRKLVLKEKVGDEIAAVRTAFGPRTAIAGFYSYGELCPASYEDRACLMHNQTMTITALREI